MLPAHLNKDAVELCRGHRAYGICCVFGWHGVSKMDVVFGFPQPHSAEPGRAHNEDLIGKLNNRPLRDVLEKLWNVVQVDKDEDETCRGVNEVLMQAKDK